MYKRIGAETNSSPHLNTDNMDFSSHQLSLIGLCTDKVFPNDIYTKLCNIYTQLYPSSRLTFVSRSYIHSKRASIGELLIASSINERHSTVAEYRPEMGTSITFHPLLHFLKHSVKLTDTSNEQYQKTYFLQSTTVLVPYIPRILWKFSYSLYQAF